MHLQLAFELHGAVFSANEDALGCTVSRGRLREHVIWSGLLLFTLHIAGLQVQLERLPCHETKIAVSAFPVV